MPGIIRAIGLRDYQFLYRGMRFGDGFPIGLTKMDGLDDLDVRVGDRDFPRTHGQIGGRHLAAHRLLNLEFVVTGTSTSFERNFQQLLNAMSPDGELDHSYAEDEADKLYFKLPNQPEQFIRCRPVRRRIQRRPDTEWGVRLVTIQLRANDPRKYQSANKSTTAHGAASTIGKFFVRMDGGARAYPTITWQRTNIEVTPNTMPPVDIASMDIFNYGSKNIDTYGYDKLIDPANWISRLRIDNLNQPAGGPNDHSTNNLQVYQCNMDAYIRGVNELVITRIGTRRTDSIAEGPIAEFDEPVNEYGKWRLPRQPFFLVPGVNNLYVPNVNGTVKFFMDWHDTWM